MHVEQLLITYAEHARIRTEDREHFERTQHANLRAMADLRSQIRSFRGALDAQRRTIEALEAHTKANARRV